MSENPTTPQVETAELKRSLNIESGLMAYKSSRSSTSCIANKCQQKCQQSMRCSLQLLAAILVGSGVALITLSIVYKELAIVKVPILRLNNETTTPEVTTTQRPPTTESTTTAEVTTFQRLPTNYRIDRHDSSNQNSATTNSASIISAPPTTAVKVTKSQRLPTIESTTTKKAIKTRRPSTRRSLITTESTTSYYQ